jgi:ABC-2 type transport system ATP-binding protein
VLQASGIDRELTVREILGLYAPLYPRPRRVDEAVEIVGLTGKEGARVKTLSGGQRRRLDLALGIIGDPELIFLDEPTTGFDPSARRRSWGLIGNLRSLGKTILLTTHYMDEAQHLADRVAVIAAGRIVAEGHPDTIGGRSGDTVVSFGLPAGLAMTDLPGRFEGAVLRGETVELSTPQPTAALHALTGWAIERGLELADLRVDRPSLEDVYLELTEGNGDG